MAVDSTPLLKRRESLLAKVETTTGTAESLVADDGKFNIYGVTWNEDIQIEQRLDQASFGRLAAIHGTRFATVEFECDLVGNGATGVPTWASTFLVACGFNQSSGVFTTGYNASQPTLTIGFYQDGVKHAIAGAAGSVTFPLRAGFPCRARFSFTGKIVADSDVALVTPTAFDTKPPRFAGNAVTFGSFTPRLSQLEIQVNSTLKMRDDPADATGARSCVIVDRELIVTADPEATLAATRDWQSLITSHTEEALSAAIGTASNNTMTFTHSKLQWTAAQPGEREGLTIRQVTGQLNGDGLVLTFT